jgi:hypothetical protein
MAWGDVRKAMIEHSQRPSASRAEGGAQLGDEAICLARNACLRIVKIFSGSLCGERVFSHMAVASATDRR